MESVNAVADSDVEMSVESSFVYTLAESSVELIVKSSFRRMRLSSPILSLVWSRVIVYTIAVSNVEFECRVNSSCECGARSRIFVREKCSVESSCP